MASDRGARRPEAGAGLWLNALLPALKQFDCLLERAVAAAPSAYGQKAAADVYRGLSIGKDDVERLLAREPGEPVVHARGADAEADQPEGVADGSRLAWLRRAFDLSPFDIDLLLIALTLEVDLRYERLYAYLQDGVTRRRPSVDLALSLLCTSAATKVLGRAHFCADSPLTRRVLLRLITDPHQVEPPLAARSPKLDEQSVRFALGQDGMDERLVSFVRLLGR